MTHHNIRLCDFKGCDAPAAFRVAVPTPDPGGMVLFACHEHAEFPGVLRLQDPETVTCGACGRLFRIEHKAAGELWIFRFCPICGERRLA